MIPLGGISDKKALVILVINLILFCNISFTTLSDENFLCLNGKTHYVGGSGPGNYTTIQSAINNASKGDIIFVYNGVYNEKILLNKSVNLSGQNKSQTVINGGGKGTVIKVIADNVAINGFTIKNCKPFSENSCIYVKSNHTVVSENIITNDEEFGNSYGIYLKNASDNQLSENLVVNNYQSGIYITNSFRNNIIGNIITDNLITSIQISYSKNNKIQKNTLYDSVCIMFLESYDNLISSNNFYIIGSALLICESENNVIINNNFIKIMKKNILARFTFIIYSTNNTWDGNYWNRPRIIPKLIFNTYEINGKKKITLNFDWHPVDKPYKIENFIINNNL